MQITDWLEYIRDHAWIVQVFVAVLVTLLFNFMVKLAFNRLERLSRASAMTWDDILLRAARTPLRWMSWLVGLTWAASIPSQLQSLPVLEALQPIRTVGVITLMAWFLVRLIKALEQVVQNPQRMNETLDATTAMALSKVLRASVIITSALVCMQTLGFSISGVLAFGGIGGIAVGFAAKDLLANFFGGLMIYLDRPFAVGDWIRSADKEIEGTVEHIGWRLTRIRTFTKRPLYVPNATFASISVENPSRMSHRRIYETISVRYEDSQVVTKIVDQVRQMLQTHDDIDATQTLIVNVNQFAASSIDFFIYVFTKTVDWVDYHHVKQAVLLKINEIVIENGAEIAFPTQTLHLASCPNPEMAGLSTEACTARQ